MALPPGPRHSSLRQLLEFTMRPLPYFDRCLREHGELFTLRMAGLGTYVMVSSPALVKQVFTGDAEVLHAGKANWILAPLVGERSMILLDGDRHLRQRRLLLPPFHGERMRSYAAVMAEVTHATLDRWPVGRPFSLHPHMQAITLEVILRAVFGMDDPARIAALEPLLVQLMEPPPAIMALAPVLQRDFPGSPFRGFLRRRAAVIREITAFVAAARRDEAQRAGRTDILSLLLAARDDKGEPLSDGELVDELITMLVAGHETTATALSWAFACILGDRAIEARLTAEIEGVGDDAEPGAAGALPYLDAVIKETLRLRPIVPDVVRQTQAPYALGGYELPAGVNVTPFIYGVHRRPDLYPEPERFLPDRFLGVKPDPYTWFPFGGGIRRCIGMAFALYEMTIVLATVLRRARLRLAGPVHVVRRTIALAPSGGTTVVLEERRDRARRLAAAS